MNDIKKALYKQNTTAHLISIRTGVAYYKTHIEEGFVRFNVPVNDMGDAEFFPEMPAKLLIRWIDNLQEY